MNNQFRVTQFIKFHNALMSNAPKDWKPYYFPCKKNRKDPDPSMIFMKTNQFSWKNQNTRLEVKEVINLIEKGFNIGLAGRGQLINVDIDNEEYVKLLPTTLTAISRSRKGKHGFYWKHPDDKILPCNIPTDHGEVRAAWQYVLIPGSYVPTPECKDKLAGYYTVDIDIAPTVIKFEQLPFFFKEQYEDDKKAEARKAEIKKETIPYNKNKSALFDLKISDIITTKPGVREEHPLHESETGHNFSISKDGCLAHCWRHLVSLNALQFLTVKSGYMYCQNAGTRHKSGISHIDDGAIFYAWVEAKKIGLIPKEDRIPTKAMKYIAKKHKIVAADFNEELLPSSAYNKVIKIVEGEY